MKTFVMGMATLAIVVAGVTTSRADFKESLSWCISSYTKEPGELDCANEYVATYPECLTSGGRSCLMKKAVASAKDAKCDMAFRLALICQCHSDGGRSEIEAAGKQAVCDFLKSR